MNVLYCIKLALIIASLSLQPLHSPLINQIPGAVYSLYCVCVLLQWCCYLFQNPDRGIPGNYLFLVCITRADNSQTGPPLPLVSLEDTTSTTSNLNLQIPVLRNATRQRTPTRALSTSVFSFRKSTRRYMLLLQLPCNQTFPLCTPWIRVSLRALVAEASVRRQGWGSGSPITVLGVLPGPC